MMINALALFIEVFCGLLEWCILLQVFYSWIRPNSTSYFYQLISSVVIPIYKPIRRIIPSLGPLDLTPLIALLLVEAFGYIIINLLIQLV